MNKNIIKTIAFILAFGALPAELLHASPLTSPAVAEVTHNYEDTHGRHTARYEAHPEGTLKKLRYLKIGNRVLGLAGLASGALFAMASTMALGLEWGMTISGGGKTEDLIAPAAMSAGIAVATGALGVRSLSHAQKAARMLQRHVSQPTFPQKSLENPALKDSVLEWFLKSKETKPIEVQINTNKSL